MRFLSMSDDFNITAYINKIDNRIIKKFNFEGEDYEGDELTIAPLTDAERLFASRFKLIISDDLSPKIIRTIIDLLIAGKPLSDDLRQKVITAQEFYNSHALIFKRRSEETAHLGKESSFIKKAIRTYLPRSAQSYPILDAGCGIGRLSFNLLKSGFNVYGVDLSDRLIAIASSVAAKINPSYSQRFSRGNILNLNYPNNHFICVMMMWHTICEVSSALDVAVAEVRKVLMPGGIFIFDVPDVTSDLTRMHYEGGPGRKDYSTFLAKVPALGVLRKVLEEKGFELLYFRRLKWRIHKYVVVARKK